MFSLVDLAGYADLLEARPRPRHRYVVAYRGWRPPIERSGGPRVWAAWLDVIRRGV